jgi:vacuolar-type H+-ATPase subunit H
LGKLSATRDLANQGVVDQAKGAAKETWGNAKDAAKEVQQSHQNAATTRHMKGGPRLSQSVQNAENKASEKIDEFKERHSAIQPNVRYCRTTDRPKPQRLVECDLKI